ncbi:hypothetical protein [Gimesia chilikensis]|uniref:hypothetical protein n=1 Tax=Gimesia chilikensis TaxID=2605989 RepID=UPI001187998E|nr:hypothetical protein [Gimesia chilikensis]QDT87384.1 hypothetical protein MalM14_50690 [Gimesia chilikensis]
MSYCSGFIESPEFQELSRLIEAQLERDSPGLTARISSLRSELDHLEECRKGWQLSLANPHLAHETRVLLEQEIANAVTQAQEIENRIAELESAKSTSQSAFSPEAIAESLARLAELLEGEHASAMNVVLAQHIEGIYCDDTGKVSVRICRLGALANPDELINILVESANNETSTLPADSEVTQIRGRRRTRRILNGSLGDDDTEDFVNDFAVDPHRYSQLGDEWFTEDVFQIPDRPLSWSAAHSREIAEYRVNNQVSMKQTAAYFNTTVPTIRKALKYAKEHHGINALGKSISQDSRKYWAKDHALEVAQFFRRPGASMKKAEAIFGKSQPTLSKAKRLAVDIEKMMEASSRTG